MHFQKSLCLATFIAFLCFGPAMSHAQTQTNKQAVSFKANTLIETDTLVSGDLTLPAGAEGKVAAVVVIHSAGGYEDPTRAPYVQALNQAGIATLELNLFPAGGRPKSSLLNLPQTFGALMYLAQLPQIDSERIGIMGFSHGGLLSLLSSSKKLNNDYTGGKFKFAAHLPLYPVCWAHLVAAEGKNAVYPKNVYAELTGAPVHILAGAKDDYDAPDTCQKFIDALPEAARPQVALTMYPDATHGWDTDTDKNYKDHAANQGRGAYVRHFRNAATAQQSLDFARQFFTTHLSAK